MKKVSHNLHVAPRQPGKRRFRAPPKSPPPPPKPKAAWGRYEQFYACFAGLILGLIFAKFGNPAILNKLVVYPKNIYEFILYPWPLLWGYGLLGVLIVLGLPLVRLPGGDARKLALLPAVWIGWVWLSSLHATDPRLSRLTLPYMTAVAACYYIGLLILPQVGDTKSFWGPFFVAFLCVLAIGFEQHFGGLARVREEVMANPDWRQLPAEFLKRLEKERIFGTLFYPNSFAGGLLLLLPAMTMAGWLLTEGIPKAVRVLIVSPVAVAGLACLVWSQSKAGWLIAVPMAALLWWRLPLRTLWRAGLLAVLLVAGLGLFGLRYAGYFKKGAPSVGARLGYWKAAAQVVKERPFFGAGPGCFAAEYHKRKPPEAEMAKLAHNDYLQQACDSGVPAGAAYLLAVWLPLLLRRRRAWDDALAFSIWLGLLGWAIHSFVEFHLYIPATGWIGWAFLGWLTALKEEAPPPLAARRP
ncbi:MAG: O-antigen ligase family protein [Verrucomicrobia bacterium]|nr:O-antigen ligase family protein [Verrucomicrobiota bacterium]